MSRRPEEIEVYPATVLDGVESLRLVLESSIVDPDTHKIIEGEVDNTLKAVEDSNNGLSDRYFAVAKTSGGVLLGLIGRQQPVEALLEFTQTSNPAELVNAFVLDSARGLGVGQALAQHIEAKAVADAYTELILNSGPRYKLSGWPFWTRMYGEPVGVLKDYYGENEDAMVWRTNLPREK